MLKISHLDHYYGSSHTLRDVSFDIPTGGVTTLLGRNGVGKTTLLKCLMGVEKVRGGTLTLDDRDITNLSPFARARAGLGYVPQGREIFPRLSVEENLLMGLAGKQSGGLKDLPPEIWEMFPVLNDMRHRRGGDLSGGQQQQLAIGRALQFLRDERGMTILLVEQYLDFCREIADDIYIMDRGEIMHSGPASDLDLPDVRRHLTV